MSDTTPSSSIYYTSGSTAKITTNYTSTITDPSGVVVETIPIIYHTFGSFRRRLRLLRMLKEDASKQYDFDERKRR
jgi:hypothetical protein